MTSELNDLLGGNNLVYFSSILLDGFNSEDYCRKGLLWHVYIL
jgi:hypothetical protein